MALSQVEKLEDLTFGQWAALASKLGGVEAVKAVLQGEREIITREAPRVLFDRHGRRIPPREIRGRVCDADPAYRLIRPEFKETEYSCILERYSRLMVLDQSFDHLLSARVFRDEVDRLLARIRDNDRIAGILSGFWLPVILPRIEDYNYRGAFQKYVAAACRSYEDMFPDRRFSLRRLSLRRVSFVKGGGCYGDLMIRMSQGAVVGIYFPTALQGFSIGASREQMSTLPGGFVLSGLDAVIAMVMYPDILTVDSSVPDLNLAVLCLGSGESGDSRSLIFRVNEKEMSLGLAGKFDFPNSRESSGLLFIGGDEE